MDKFLLLDLETTGLDPGRCSIIEVAARILEPGRELARYHALIKPPPIPDRAWDDVARDMHLKNGLVAEAGQHGMRVEEADYRLSAMIDENVDDPVHLMGNSVHFDRGFVARYMPLTMARLDYRQLDVTSVRLWVRLMTGEDPVFDQPTSHRAEEDVENSLAQAQMMWRQLR